MAEAGLESLDTTLRLMQVQQLARRGRLREALAVVAPGGLPPGDNTCLQAFAALTTGAGDYRAALPLWRLLLERDPNNREALRMIATIELWQARPGWMQWFWPVVAAIGGIALVGLLLAVL